MTKKSASRKISDTLKSAAAKQNLDILAAMEQRWQKREAEIVQQWQEMLRLACAASVYSTVRRSQFMPVITGSFSTEDVEHMLAHNNVEFAFDPVNKRWNFKITPKAETQEDLDV
jgi:hypothetical protein